MNTKDIQTKKIVVIFNLPLSVYNYDINKVKETQFFINDKRIDRLKQISLDKLKINNELFFKMDGFE